MRQIWLITVFLAATTVSAQPYIPMLGEENEWRIVSCFNGCVTSAYYTSGETVVDGNNYHVLDGYHYINGNMLLREDVQQRKVYLKQTFGHSLLSEFVLYDFSLEDGDTVNVYNPISPLPEDGGKFVLDSIVPRMLETGEHRHFYLHAVDPQSSLSERTVWVEGIGALSLINSPGALPTEEDHLVCAMKDGELIYSDLDSVYSCGPLNIERQEDKLEEFIAYPVPVDEVVNLKYSGQKSPEEITLISIDGRTVFRSPWKTELNIGELDAGIYLIRLHFSAGTILVKKVLKTGQNSTR